MALKDGCRAFGCGATIVAAVQFKRYARWRATLHLVASLKRGVEVMCRDLGEHLCLMSFTSVPDVLHSEVLDQVSALL